MWLVNATPLTIRSLCLSGLCSGSILALGVVALIVYHARLALTESHSYLVGVFVRRAIGTGRRTTLVKGTFKRISLFSSFLVDDWIGGYLNGTPDRFNECFRWCLGKLCSWLLKSNYVNKRGDDRGGFWLQLLLFFFLWLRCVSILWIFSVVASFAEHWNGDSLVGFLLAIMKLYFLRLVCYLTFSCSFFLSYIYIIV